MPLPTLNLCNFKYIKVINTKFGGVYVKCLGETTRYDVSMATVLTAAMFIVLFFLKNDTFLQQLLLF